jgi:septum formation protein
MNIRDVTIVLASASPRRQELLRLLLEDFEILFTSIDEKVEAAESPEMLVKRLAEAKARAVLPLRPDALIIGADTIVVHDSQILGKPRSREEARGMLTLLAGHTHSVLTGICLLWGSRYEVEVSRSFVTFSPLTNEEIEAYLKTGEPMDKAGAYAIQGAGARFIEKVEGCYFNVVGLPVSLIYQRLRRIGCDFHG